MIDFRYTVISVIGPHAEETTTAILDRKIKDIRIAGLTFWLIKSRQAKPKMVQQICLEAHTKNAKCYCVLIEPSSKYSVSPTKEHCYAKEYSKDGVVWHPLPKELSPVTGKIDNASYALVFKQLKLVTDYIDLWQYADFFNRNDPVRIIRGSSTVCAIRKSLSNDADKIKSHIRRVVAIGELCDPFCVYLR